MAFECAGFNGDLNEADFARIIGEGGQPYSAPFNYATGLPDQNALAPSIVAGGTRQVSINAGGTTGWGVRAKQSTPTVKAHDPVTTTGATRWDVITLRRDWTYTNPEAPNPGDPGYVGGRATLEIIKGGATRPTEATGFPAGRLSTPGDKDDEPVCLVRLVGGQTLPQEIVDLRRRPSKLFMADDLLAVPQTVGTVADIKGVRYYRRMVGSFPAWVRDGGPFAVAAFTGVVGVPTPANSIIGPLPYKFPAGRFTVAPVVTFGYSDTRCSVSATALTRDGFNVYIRNLTGQNSPAGGVLHWVATQVNPTSAVG